MNCIHFAESSLNAHESERCKPSAWIPVAFLPIYDQKKDRRPTLGYQSSKARKQRLFHQVWHVLLSRWKERTREPLNVPWADGVTRKTRFFVGGVLGDQQEADRYTANPCACHRCKALHKDFLSWRKSAPAKNTKRTKFDVEMAAKGLAAGRRSVGAVVLWDADGSNVRPGPGKCINCIKLFKSRKCINY